MKMLLALFTLVNVGAADLSSVDRLHGSGDYPGLRDLFFGTRDLRLKIGIAEKLDSDFSAEGRSLLRAVYARIDPEFFAALVATGAVSLQKTFFGLAFVEPGAANDPRMVAFVTDAILSNPHDEVIDEIVAGRALDLNDRAARATLYGQVIARTRNPTTLDTLANDLRAAGLVDDLLPSVIFRKIELARAGSPASFASLLYGLLKVTPLAQIAPALTVIMSASTDDEIPLVLGCIHHHVPGGRVDLPPAWLDLIDRLEARWMAKVLRETHPRHQIDLIKKTNFKPLRDSARVPAMIAGLLAREDALVGLLEHTLLENRDNTVEPWTTLHHALRTNDLRERRSRLTAITGPELASCDEGLKLKH